jgi:MFS family permease
MRFSHRFFLSSPSQPVSLARPPGDRSDVAVEAAAVAAAEPRNLACLVAYQVVSRIGWIFKTETVIMPAVLDACVDSGLLRGLLPVLNRAGHSLVPLLVAPAVAQASAKRKWLMATTAGLAGCFGLLAVTWAVWATAWPALMAGIFLVLYTLFSAINGCNQLVVAALQGRLIAAGHRGRLLLLSVTIGSVLAIAAAVWLLGPWLQDPNGFVKIFAVTAVFFGLAACVPLFFKEPSGMPKAGPVASQERVWDHWREVGSDPALVRLAVVAACFSVVLMLFPHYQAFARDRLGTKTSSLLTWVIVQNGATGLASLVVGPFADSRGNRLVLIGLIGLCTLTPLVVCGLSLLPADKAANWFWLVYLPLGLNPIILRIFSNFALELSADQSRQPQYVSLVGAALAVPFLGSPAVGWCIDQVGAEPIFICGAAVIAVATVVAVGLPEPRLG